MKTSLNTLKSATLTFVLCVTVIQATWATAIDLSQSTLVLSEGSEDSLAATVLTEELVERTGICFPVSTTWPADRNRIVLMTIKDSVFSHYQPDSVKKTIDHLKPEGFCIVPDTSQSKTSLWVIGFDKRGALYGVGYLLRKSIMKKDSIRYPETEPVASSPAYPIRGHQLGYRARANSYDAWDAGQYEQYIRELILFGANCIENIPFQDTQDSPHIKLTRDEMNLVMSGICKRYGIDYWLWIPADFDLNDLELRKKNIDKNRTFYSHCPKIDAIFVPGGDPGDNHPRLLLPYMEELSRHLMEFHPEARMWISLQGFDREQIDYFYSYLETQKPAWLGGVVAGPSSPPIPETRMRLPQQYRLRHYPDITHTVRCQYPVPWWDPAFAFTHGREAINPQPVFYATIHNYYAPFTDGFLTYSDGVNDDLNKTVWSQLGWDPQTPLQDILLDYARFFFGDDVAKEAADGILALEKNWEGPLNLNASIESTNVYWSRLALQFDRLDTNWRWQMCQLRACYDAYTRQRLLYETALEEEANQCLGRAQEIGADRAIDEALKVLQRADSEKCNPALRKRIEDLCDDLYQSIGLQTSMEKYQASGAERGCYLDFVDHPLNNRWWFEDEFDKIRKLGDENEKMERLDRIRTWESPGPGSFYDDIGNVAKSPHVIRGEGYNTDPTMERNPNPDTMWWDQGRSRLRPSWISYMNWPIGMVYNGLDPNADYIVRLSGYGEALLKIDGERVEPFVYNKGIGELKEFPVSPRFLNDRKITLTWDVPNESHLNWRQQSRLNEVWLIKK